MKKTKIVLGAAVLTVGAMIVGRASNKFAGPAKLYYTSGIAHTCKQLATSVSSAQLTTGASGVNAFFRTAAATSNSRLFATISSGGACQKPLNILP